jgi:hypothetical protein
LSSLRRSRVGTTSTEPRTKRDKHLYSETSRSSFPVALTQKNIPHWSAARQGNNNQASVDATQRPPIVSATTTTTSFVSYDRGNPSIRPSGSASGPVRTGKRSRRFWNGAGGATGFSLLIWAAVRTQEPSAPPAWTLLSVDLSRTARSL